LLKIIATPAASIWDKVEQLLTNLLGGKQCLDFATWSEILRLHWILVANIIGQPWASNSPHGWKYVSVLPKST
jgi:hypothetical protein